MPYIAKPPKDEVSAGIKGDLGKALSKVSFAIKSYETLSSVFEVTWVYKEE